MKKPENLLYKKHVLSISDFHKPVLELIIEKTKQVKSSSKIEQNLKNKVIGSCFFEPSTRTRLSFDAAIKLLGGSIIGFDSGINTSLQKGETLTDSIRVISSYVDAIILRHPREGSARLASQVSSVPIINGGDGANQHPTQTLLDLFSIYECQKNSLEKIIVAFVGDLKYGRTVHSLIQALIHFNTEFIFISPSALSLPDNLIAILDEKKIRYHHRTSLDEAVQHADIVYMTRLQKERLDETEYQYIKVHYRLEKKMLDNAKPSMKILHPLPRLNEIDKEIDTTPFAYYFQQSHNGLYARMALLSLLLNQEI